MKNLEQKKNKKVSANRQRGKTTEKNIAKLIGGKRIGILGKDDVQAGSFSIEVKDREKSTAHKFMEQACRNCPPALTPLVIIHKKNSCHHEDLVCIKLKDWLDWYGSSGDLISSPLGSSLAGKSPSG